MATAAPSYLFERNAKWRFDSEHQYQFGSVWPQNSTENESFSVPLPKRIHAVRKHQLEGEE